MSGLLFTLTEGIFVKISYNLQGEVYELRKMEIRCSMQISCLCSWQENPDIEFITQLNNLFQRFFSVSHPWLCALYSAYYSYPASEREVPSACTCSATVTVCICFRIYFQTLRIEKFYHPHFTKK